jgi:hypothetical protein
MAKVTCLRIVRWLSLLSSAVTLGALTAHVLELPNKLALDGPLWLAVQQNLYRGWGPFIGPFEVTAIAATWVLLRLVRQNRSSFGLTLLAALLLSGALVIFFALNAPVNAAFASWTAATLPPDWPNYRLRWETGHAISFVLVLIAFIALLRALFREAVTEASCKKAARQCARADADKATRID